MDEDYRQVALPQAAPVTAPPGPAGRACVAAAVVVVFGILVTTAAVQTSQNADVEDASRATLIAQVEAERDAVAREQDRIAELQDDNIALEDELRGRGRRRAGDHGSAASAPDAGPASSGARRPGVRITVDDPPDADLGELVRDEDLALLVDGLWARRRRGDRHQRPAADRAHRDPQPRPGGAREQPAGEPAVRRPGHRRHRRRSRLTCSTRRTAGQFFDRATNFGFRVDMENDGRALPARRLGAARSATCGRAPARTP